MKFSKYLLLSTAACATLSLASCFNSANKGSNDEDTAVNFVDVPEEKIEEPVDTTPQYTVLENGV